MVQQRLRRVSVTTAAHSAIVLDLHWFADGDMVVKAQMWLNDKSTSPVAD
jgi:hypothetical protein